MARLSIPQNQLSRNRSTSPPSTGSIGATLVAVLLFVLLLGGPPAGGATTDTAEEAGETAEAEEVDPAALAEAELLREGQQVYSQVCSSCHQPGGTGISGQFPPLLDNPNVDDDAYVAEVIDKGRQGEIVVAGETYDGVMPSFSTLTDDEVAAITAFIQNDFMAPAADGSTEAEATGPVAGTELPALTNMGSVAAYLLAAAVIFLVLAPRLIGTNDRLSTPWLDAWLKTAAIVVAVYLLVIHVPNWALQQGSVGRLGRFGQDLIGTGLWTIGLALLLGGLWYAHRESRI